MINAAYLAIILGILTAFTCPICNRKCNHKTKRKEQTADDEKIDEYFNCKPICRVSKSGAAFKDSFLEIHSLALLVGGLKKAFMIRKFEEDQLVLSTFSL